MMKKVLNKMIDYLPRLNRRGLTILGIDTVMAALALAVSFYVRLGGDFSEYHGGFVFMHMLLFAVVGAVVFYFSGLFRGLWRYTSLTELLKITKTATLSVALYAVIVFLLTRLEHFPRSSLLIQWVMLIGALSGPRIFYRLLKDRTWRTVLEQGQEANRIPVIVVGAGDHAEEFIRAISRDRSAAYRVVGAVSNRLSRVGMHLHGVEVMGLVAQLPEVLEKLSNQGFKPQRLIVTNDIAGNDLVDLLAKADQFGLTVSRSPGVTELKSASSVEREMRPVMIEDLLGRPQTVLDKTVVDNLIRGRRVLVTGAGGSIGSELVRQIATFQPSELMLLDHSEHNLYLIDLEVKTKFSGLNRKSVLCDVRDAAQVDKVFDDFHPDVVFHAAAYKHVPIVEENPLEGILTNVIGTRNVAEATRRCKALAMVQISTDKAVNPSSVMGATKRLAEAYCQAMDIHERAQKDGVKMITVRFGNVLGSNGSVVPLFQDQLSNGGPITITHPDVKRYFMTIREAVELVLQAAARGQADQAATGKIYILDMGEPVKIVDLAKQMIRLAGLKPDEDIKLEFVGLRPGEKIFEELFHESEQPAPTECQGLVLATPRTLDYKQMNSAITKLEKLARNRKTESAMDSLHDLIPEYGAPEEDKKQD